MNKNTLPTSELDPQQQWKEVLGNGILIAELTRSQLFTDALKDKIVADIREILSEDYILNLISTYREKAEKFIAAIILYAYTVHGTIENCDEYALYPKLDQDLRSFLDSFDDIAPKGFGFLHEHKSKFNEYKVEVGSGIDWDTATRDKPEVQEYHTNLGKRMDHEVKKILSKLDEEAEKRLELLFTERRTFAHLRVSKQKLRVLISRVMTTTSQGEDDDSLFSDSTYQDPLRISIEGRRFDLCDIHTAEGRRRTRSGGKYKGLQQDA